MNVVDYVRYLWPEGLYSLITTVYLINLNKLNKKLLAINYDNPFQLLGYEDSTPLKCFAIALSLFFVGIAVIIYRIHSIKYYAFSFGEILSALLAILVIFIFLVLVFVFIDNPIFRAILAVLSIGIGSLYVYVK